MLLSKQSKKLTISADWTKKERNKLKKIILAEKRIITSLASVSKKDKQVKNTHKFFLVCKNKELSKLLRILQCHKACNLEKKRSLFFNFIKTESELEKTK